jgi:hypothetical protein
VDERFIRLQLVRVHSAGGHARHSRGPPGGDPPELPVQKDALRLLRLVVHA